MILEELVEAVRAIEPELLDPREAAAIVESLGYNDGAAAEEFGLDNTLELGQLVYARRAPCCPEVDDIECVFIGSMCDNIVGAVGGYLLRIRMCAKKKQQASEIFLIHRANLPYFTCTRC